MYVLDTEKEEPMDGNVLQNVKQFCA